LTYKRAADKEALIRVTSSVIELKKTRNGKKNRNQSCKWALFWSPNPSPKPAPTYNSEF